MWLTYRVAIVLVLTLFIGKFSYSAMPDPKEELTHASDRESKGRFDEALVLYKSAAKHAEEQSNHDLAAKIFLELGDLLRKMGRTKEALEILNRCTSLDQNTKQAGVCQASFDLLAVDSRIISSTELSDQLDILQRILSVEKRPLLENAQNWQDAIKSRALTRRVYLYKQFFDVFGSQLKEKKARALSPQLQIFLVAALRDTPPKELDPYPESRKKELPIALLSELDAEGALDQAVLKKALQLNSALMELDKDDRLAQAINISQRSDIHDKLGHTPQAIALKREAVDLFYQYGSFEDIINALYGLTGLYVGQNSSASRVKALELSRKQIMEIENQVLAMSGESSDHFFKRAQKIYDRYFKLLLDQYNDQNLTFQENKDRILEQVILQADRMNFRAVRRDIALYRELGPEIKPENELLQRLAEQRMNLEASQQKLEHFPGKEEAAIEFPFGKGVDIFIAEEKLEGPFTAVKSAKEKLIGVLEDYKRTQLEDQNREVRLPSSLYEVTQGMSDQEALIMYFRYPPPDHRLSAAVIKEGGKVRWIPDLRISAGKDLNDTIEAIKSLIVDLESPLESPEMKDALEHLSKTLWQPLGDLPENLTIILTPDLIGLPFESLLLKNGLPAITAHRVRYAFGLEQGVGAAYKPQAVRHAFIMGAAIENLSAKEIEELQRLFNKQEVAIFPKDGLPIEGKPLFLKDGNFDVIHVSTHSDSDKDLPMMDALKFPRDKVFAYELAFSPIRANLMVLSACELFKGRGENLNPVSGITTAAMARVAPEVVSTLWNVNAEATRIFMLRFYDALFQYQDPSVALAVTKRDFLDPQALKKWFESAAVELPAIPIDELRKPYYWAPFVLVTSSKN
jgi:tetratricopeptide (TPR) repeat protein